MPFRRRNPVIVAICVLVALGGAALAASSGGGSSEGEGEGVARLEPAAAPDYAFTTARAAPAC